MAQSTPSNAPSNGAKRGPSRSYGRVTKVDATAATNPPKKAPLIEATPVKAAARIRKPQVNQ